MKKHNCQVVSKDELVAYADGELSANRSERIAEHIANCPNCRSMAEALQRSLQVTQVIWKTSEARWPETHSFDRIRTNRRSFNKVAAVAACILLLLFGVGLTWRLLTEGGGSTRVIGKEPTAAEIEIRTNRAAVAAQMLAVADLFASQPGGEEYAMKRYNYIINSFPERKESAQAKLRLKTFIERRVEQ